MCEIRAARRTAPTGGAFFESHRRGGAVRRPGLRSFSGLRAARRTAPTGYSSKYTVGAVFNRPPLMDDLRT